ncbi:acyl-CoA dehydrogenase family protein [Microbacterium gorillae]|uniref:acyl-CoA dehydrogenase family protein n=1 Tax=Microbacterium gorillae TaxID=1231063 RepID=UPI000590AC68|nr:acyl-CoA dehydrogenase family protein [Microbacterium gorillae]
MTAPARRSRTAAAVAAPADRARGLLAVLGTHAQNADRSGRLTAPILSALSAAGLFRLGAPEHAGGSAADSTTIAETVAVLAEEHASTAWVVGSFAQAAARLAAETTPSTPSLIDGASAPLVCESPVVGGEAEKASGGYRIHGQWHSVPGSAHADLFIGSVALPAGEAGEVARVLLPMSAVVRHETWGASGLRGASADTIAAEGVFVAEGDLRRDGPRRGYDPGQALVPAATVVGAAAGALDHALAVVRSRPWFGTTYETAAESPTIQGLLSDAAMHLSGARLHLRRAAATMDRARVVGTPLSPAARARCRLDLAGATSSSVAAMAALMSTVGAEAVAESAPFERAERDIRTLSRHGAVDPLTAREAFGRFLLADDGPLHDIAL